jgi:hypothetical protein
VERARDLPWEDGIRCGGGADGVHVATVLELKCEEFITNNTSKGPGHPDAAAKLLTKNLRVVRAQATYDLPEKYRPGPLFDSSTHRTMKPRNTRLKLPDDFLGTVAAFLNRPPPKARPKRKPVTPKKAKKR